MNNTAKLTFPYLKDYGLMSWNIIGWRFPDSETRMAFPSRSQSGKRVVICFTRSQLRNCTYQVVIALLLFLTRNDPLLATSL